jgi:hypothetical protein
MIALAFAFLTPLAQLPVVENTEFSANSQQTALVVTVRVLNRTLAAEGSGVMVGKDEYGVYVLTAAHLLEGADLIEVQTFTSTSYPKAAATISKIELVAKSDPLRDLALMRLPPTKELPPLIRIAQAADNALKTPFSCLIVGCATGKPPACKIERVVDAKRARRKAADEAVLFWEVAKKQAAGQSGGPLIDQRGFVIGICSGNNKELSYFCHLEEIHAFLRALDFQWLFEAKSRSEKQPAKAFFKADVLKPIDTECQNR